MNTRRLMALVALAAMVMTAPSASAQDAKGDKADRKADRKEVKEDKKDVKDAKQDLKEAKKDAREAARDGGGGDAAAVKEARMKLGEARKALKDSREERRTNARAALRAKWGPLADKPAVRAELRLHAQRMAKLRMMKNVADDADKKNLEERVDKLIDKEKARHDLRMDALKAKNGEDTK